MTKFNALMLTASAAAILAFAPIARAADDQPEPKGGAVKGAVAGGVAGHMMGGHTKTGAAVGAVAGHHERNKSQARINAGGKP